MEYLEWVLRFALIPVLSMVILSLCHLLDGESRQVNSVATWTPVVALIVGTIGVVFNMIYGLEATEGLEYFLFFLGSLGVVLVVGGFIVYSVRMSYKHYQAIVTKEVPKRGQGLIPWNVAYSFLSVFGYGALLGA